MHDARLVGDRQRGGHLGADPGDLRFLQRGAVLDEVGEGLTVDQFHHDPRQSVLVIELVVDGDDVRVLERAGGPGLPLHAFHQPVVQPGIPAHLGFELLEHDVPAHPLVMGPPDGAHSALAQHLQQSIPAGHETVPVPTHGR
nr:hypothetical protein [Thermomonospora catenispora]